MSGSVGIRSFTPSDSSTTLRLEPRRDNDVDRDVTDVGGGVDIEVVRAYRLGQNHPNPFNPVTTIEFEIPRPGAVHLVVYDASGRFVRRLLSKQYGSATRDRVTWDGRDHKGNAVSSGLYFYRLEADDWTATRKMLLLK